MDLNELQRQRDIWVDHNFPAWREQTESERMMECLMGAIEELGEIAHHILKMRQGIRGKATEAETKMYHETEIIDGVADCVIFLAGIPTALGAAYGDIVAEAWDTVKQRDWQAYPERGVPSA